MRKTYTLWPRSSRLRLPLLLAFVAALVVVLTVRSCPPSLPPDWDGNESRTPNFRLSGTEDETPEAFVDDAQVLAGEDFQFLMGEGSGRDGYDLVKLRADGSCEYTFGEWQLQRKVWRRAEFQVAPETVADLRRLLVEVNYFRLKRRYHADAHDGTQWLVKARAAGRAKRVYCNNHFPAKIIKLSGFVRTRLLDPHRAEIAGAKAVELAPMDQWNEFESP